MADNEVPKNDEKDSQRKKGVNRRQFITRVAAGAGALAATSVLGACGGSSSTTPLTTALSETNLTAGAWRFGVISDTQWIGADDGNNPYSCAVSIINQINSQFINDGVKFVVHVGDLCDNGSLAGEQVRCLYTQALYNAGIGFFPLRGNHDDYANVATEFVRVYPQTQNGVHNNTPGDIFAMTVPSPDVTNQPPSTKSGSTFTLGSNFSSPSTGLKGLSYTFDYNNARFILLDQFKQADSTYGIGGNPGMDLGISTQQSWITGQITGRASGSHAFLFAHKGVFTNNHADGLFSLSSGNPTANPTAQDAYIASMYDNGARYHFCGHDHMYDRSLISNTTGTKKITQILTASDSSKFYIPHGNPQNSGAPYTVGTNNDGQWNLPTYGIRRQTILQQELRTVGFYIVTVDGANVVVEYYAADIFPTYDGTSEYLVSSVPASLNFVKRDSFGYGLNGKEFVIAQGASYTTVQDASPWGTTAKILGGKNLCVLKDASGDPSVGGGQPFSKAVNTGWSPKVNGVLSDVLVLQGMYSNLGSQQTDPFPLSMSASGVTAQAALSIATLNSSGVWTNAVNENFGGAKTFVNGPWKSTYGVGTYGIDTNTNTVWAVLNYNGPFALAANV